MSQKFRACDECTECCTGHLTGNAHGHDFGNGTPCFFLKKKCSIYSNRPSVCQKYQCAWSQYLLDEDLRPDKSGLLVSVINGKEKQFLEIIETKPLVPYESYARVYSRAKELNAEIRKVDYFEYRNNDKRGCRSSDISDSCTREIPQKTPK